MKKNPYVFIVETAYDSKKKPKMLDQACANGLKLDDIPQDLQEISNIERRIISLRLPF